MTTLFPFRKLVADDEWEAEEDLTVRFGLVAHAAFLHSGFVPYGDKPRSGHLLKQVDTIGSSGPRLSCVYTARQLAARREAADFAVLELRARGNGDVAFQAYNLARGDGDRRLLSCEALLDGTALVPLLDYSLADAARALETGSAGAWLWKPLADWVVPALFHEICRRNDLPVTGFACLPDDAVAEILKRLTDGVDLARVECTSAKLRRLVADRDGELWKAMYESLDLPPEDQSSDESESERPDSWKERYVKGKQRLTRRRLLGRLWDDEDENWLSRFHRVMEAAARRMEAVFLQLQRQREADLPVPDIYDGEPVEQSQFPDFAYYRRRHWAADFERRSPWEADWQRAWSVPRVNGFIAEPVEFTGFARYQPAREPQREVAETRRGQNAGRQHRMKVPRRNHYQKKHHGAGAIHSPSSRYKWKHR